MGFSARFADVLSRNCAYLSSAFEGEAHDPCLIAEGPFP